MLKNKKRMTFEELETIVHKIEEEERKISQLQNLHLHCFLGEMGFEEDERKSFLKLMEKSIEVTNKNIEILKGE